MLKEIKITTNKAQELIDITSQIKEIISLSKIKDGLCLMYCPHTTSGITINENTDPDVKIDILNQLGEIIPLNNHYKHSEGNSAAHIKSSLVGVSKTLIIQNYQLVLGTWQAILFCEFDGPRKRKIFVKII